MLPRSAWFGKGGMSSLERLDIYDVDMSGELPPTAVAVTNLKELRIGDTRIAGTLPASYSVLRWGAHV